MNKVFVFVGFFAICNAASLRIIPAGSTLYHQSVPLVSVARSAFAHVIPSYVHTAAPSAVATEVRSVDLSSDEVAASSNDPSEEQSTAPAVVSSIVPSFVPVTVSDAELADWEAYKEKFGKPYASPTEDRYRRNIYFATKTRVTTHNELFNHGLAAEPLQIDSFADQTRDEVFSLRSILDENQDEWNDYKVKYGKIYDTFEDRFRRTVYFIRKDTFADRNLLFAQGLSSYGHAIDNYTDYFDDELPSGSPQAVRHVVAVPAVAAVHSRAFVPSTFRQYELGPYPAYRATYPGAWQRTYWF